MTFNPAPNGHLARRLLIRRDRLDADEMPMTQAWGYNNMVDAHTVETRVYRL